VISKRKGCKTTPEKHASHSTGQVGLVPDIGPGAAFVSAAKKHLQRRDEPDFPVIENGYPDEVPYGASWYLIS